MFNPVSSVINVISKTKVGTIVDRVSRSNFIYCG